MTTVTSTCAMALLPEDSILVGGHFYEVVNTVINAVDTLVVNLRSSKVSNYLATMTIELDPYELIKIYK